MTLQKLAFVDLETTGGSATGDRITEVGVVRVVEGQPVEEWSQLVQPQMRIPVYIERMTGITNDMVAEAPLFEDIAEQLMEKLEGCLLIAHNARFDAGFLKNEFKRLGLSFRPSVLCTVKLSRRLFPEYSKHNLDSLIERYQLQADSRHRALADARAVYQFWQILQKCCDPQQLQETVKILIQHSSLPAHLDESLMDELPKKAGVYLFYGENELPLYIGKSVNIRQRVLSHFSADYRHNKEMNLSQQTRRVDWIETGGELGALLTESRLIKESMPIYNQRLRRKSALCAWLFDLTQHQTPLRLVWANELDFGRQPDLYGLYHNQKDAQKSLRNLAEQHQLCLKVLGLEKQTGGKPCFAYQLKRCKGVCAGQETLEQHALRLMMAMSKLKLASWPFKGPVGIRENQDLHIIDHWCYLGTANNEGEIRDILQSGQPVFDKDTYLTLKKALKTAHIVDLSLIDKVS